MTSCTVSYSNLLAFLSCQPLRLLFVISIIAVEAGRAIIKQRCFRLQWFLWPQDGTAAVPLSCPLTHSSVWQVLC